MNFGILNTVQSGIFLLLDLYVFAKAFGTRKLNRKHDHFTWLALIVATEQLLSMLVRMFKNDLVAGTAVLQYVVYIAMFVFMALTAWGSMRYLLYLVGYEKTIPVLKVLQMIPLTVMSVAAIVSPWTHWLFWLDENLQYNRGTMFFLQLVCPYVYAIAALLIIVSMLFKRDKMKNKQAFRYFLCFIVPAAVGMITQVFLQVDGGYSAIGISICVILLYFEFYTEEIREIERLKEEKSREELSQTNARLYALEDNFESMYDVNLETGEYIEFFKGETFSDKVSKQFVAHHEFFEDAYQNIDRVAYADDREDFKRTINRNFLRNALATDNHFDYYYRLVIDGSPAWFRMRVVYKDDKKNDIIIGIFNAGGDIESRQIAEQKALIDFFVDSYSSAYIVNLAEDTFKVIRMEHEFSQFFGTYGEDRDGMNAFIRDHIHPEDREYMLQMVDREYIAGRLRNERSYTFTCREVYGDTEKIMRGLVVRISDEYNAAIGFMDITDQMKEQQKRLLGAVPLSPDVLAKANIGLWSFELDEGKPPRMYGDEAMLRLVGLDHQVSPEEMYHAWYDHIDEEAYGLVTDAVNKMVSGEHAEVQYPWHHPDGHTMIVRCGGVRNDEYTAGIRIEGTHQDVTQTLHYDEEERRRAKQVENDLIMQKLRADSLAYISDNEPDLDSAISFFGNQILQIYGCDQVVYRELDGRKIVLNVPGFEEVPETICSSCPFSKFDCEAFEKDGTVMMNDCSLGFDGMMAPADCPAKSSFMQMVYSGGAVVGKLTVHFLKDYHSFTENGIRIMKAIAVYLGLMIGRIKEKQAEIARIEAESSNKAKTEFLFNMSHDIRTPMNAILGYTEIGMNHVDDIERSKDCYQKIKTAGDHLLSLINDILEMSRIESGTLELNENPMDIRQVIEGVDQMSAALAAGKKIAFRTEIGEILNPYIYADELHGNEVIINLISNAVKYTPEGGTVVYRVSQVGGVENGKVIFRFEVSDTGIGMSEEYQQHLFEAFSREKNAVVAKQEGAGLGLSIVKKILDLAGGTIRVKSRLGEGSVFTVEVPYRVMDDEAVAAFIGKAKAEAAERADTALAGRKVLLVEDNAMNREIATDILEESGLLVETANDGSVAVKILAEKGEAYYDFVLMDIQMPIMNGYEATKAIREMYPDAKLPIIALSANAFAEDKAASIAAGMDAHVAKPINIKELFAVLEKFL